MEDLINVPGVGDVTAQRIYLSAVQHLEAVEERKARGEEAEPEADAPALAVEAEELAEEASEEAETPVAEAEAEIAELEAAELETAEIEVAEPEVAETETAEAERVEAETAEAVIAEPEPAREPVDVAASEAAPKPKPRSVATAGRPDAYLDDIEAMESELSAGWEEDPPAESEESRPEGS